MRNITSGKVSMLLAVGTLLLTAGLIPAEEKWDGDAYPLATCPVSGQKLGSMGDPVLYEHEGREIRFCCGGCVDPFKKESAEYLKKIDAKIAEQQADSYPLETCVVSGEPLGEMGKPYDYVYKNRLVRFCCAGCKGQLKAEPSKYIEKIDQAVIEKQKDGYPLETCVVSGQRLGAMGDPVEYVHANQLVRFCCGGCISKFEKEPVKYMTAIDEAAGDGGSDEASSGKAGHEVEKTESGMKGSHGKHEGH